MSRCQPPPCICLLWMEMLRGWGRDGWLARRDFMKREELLKSLPAGWVAENAIKTSVTQRYLMPATQSVMASVLQEGPLSKTLRLWLRTKQRFSFYSSSTPEVFYSSLLFPALGSGFPRVFWAVLAIKNKKQKTKTHWGNVDSQLWVDVLFIRCDIRAFKGNVGMSRFAQWHSWLWRKCVRPSVGMCPCCSAHSLHIVCRFGTFFGRNVVTK